ncbi:MAG TPA: hypothetical protein VKX49_04565 [Bryobacteraceae bacterium]|nr:hypothetical protein [Bryobacteraceae bacterium]
MGLRLAALLVCFGCCFGGERERIVSSVLPSLAYGGSCWSSVDLQNLGDRTVNVDLESHRASGALVPIVDHPQLAISLAPGEHASFRLDIQEETGSAWIKVREHVPAGELSPVIAVAGHTECVSGNELRTTPRELAFPLRNPSFSTEIDELQDGVVSVVNTSERAAQLWLCYSEGNLYSVPNNRPGIPQLTPLCSHAFEVQLAPFAARQFPMDRQGSSHFSMKTHGESIVLQVLRPLQQGVKIYSVDSTIKFEGEAK